MFRHKVPLYLVLSCSLLLPISLVAADEEQKPVDPDKLVADSIDVLNEFVGDPKMEQFRKKLAKAAGVMIVPQWTRAGFFLGGSGGNGLVMVRHGNTWRGPVFYSYGGGSFGLQAGISVSRIIMIITNAEAVPKLIDANVKLGGAVTAAAGKAGTGQETRMGNVAEEDNIDVISYVKAKGLYAGVSIEGATMQPIAEANKAYYGQAITAEDVFVSGKVTSGKGAALAAALHKAAP